MLFINKLNLASGSPRRRDLVSYLFKNTAVLPTTCDEPRWKKHQLWSDYLTLCVETKWRAAQEAFLKSKHLQKEFLLVADTIVVLGNDVLGKPQDKLQAESYLKKLSGKTHQVWTGFCLGLWTGTEFKYIQKDTCSRVNFRTLTTKEIKEYVRSREPMDKAGAYGFQGLGIQNISKVEGSYTNIVGLPLFEVQIAARKLLNESV